MITKSDCSEWEDYCHECSIGGDALLMCEYGGCTKVYHHACVGLKKGPPGSWICPLHKDSDENNAATDNDKNEQNTPTATTASNNKQQQRTAAAVKVSQVRSQPRLIYG